MSPADTELEKKEVIAQTAVEVFAEQGFTETKIQDIADEAGIGKGTVYLYFDNKSDILYEVYVQFETMLHDILDGALEESDDPEENARQLLAELVEMLRTNKAMFRVLFDFWSQGLNSSGEFEIPFKAFYNRIRTKFEVLLEQVVDEKYRKEHSLETIAYVLIGFFEGQMVQWLMNPSSPSLDELPDIVLTILFDGLSTDR